MSQVISSLHPRKILAIKMKLIWVSHPASFTTEEHTLGLGLGWYRISGEYQIVFSSINFTYLEHSLQHISVGSKEDQVICVAKSTIPETSYVATKAKFSQISQQIIKIDREQKW